jgi:hypothetical protein
VIDRGAHTAGRISNADVLAKRSVSIFYAQFAV